MTKQQQIEELDEEINELRRILDKKNEKLEKFEEKEEMYKIRDKRDERANTVLLLNDIITMLVAPEIIQEREKQNKLNGRR